MSPGERSIVWRSLVVVLAAAAVRLSTDPGRSGTDPLAGLPDASAALEAGATAHAEDEARRSRPIGPDEPVDANRAPAAELDRLPGVGPALADRWVAHRESHGAFRGPDDLTRIPGVGPATVERLRPLLEFSPGPSMLRPRERDARIDLNSAGPADLVELPGIGPVIAERIVEHRRRRPFRTVDELVEVPGVGPATLRRLRPRVTVRRSKKRPWRRPRRRVNV
jgi:competence ComEA-like helix-hairpin-helix protein